MGNLPSSREGSENSLKELKEGDEKKEYGSNGNSY